MPAAQPGDLADDGDGGRADAGLLRDRGDLARAAPLTVRWAGSVPDCTTAAGVAGSLPFSISAPAISPSRPTPIRKTSVPRKRASTSQSISEVSLPGRSWPVTIASCAATLRCVTGMPAYAGAAIAEVMPGTTSKGTPAAESASASSPPRPKTNGSPPFSRTTNRPARAVLDEAGVDLLLRHRVVVGALRGVDQDAAGRRLVEQLVADQPVEHEHLGAPHELEPAHGDQPGVAGAGAHQVDGHARASSSSGRPPAASACSATARPSASGSSPSPSAVGVLAAVGAADPDAQADAPGVERLGVCGDRREAAAAEGGRGCALGAQDAQALGVADDAERRRRRRRASAAR